MMLNSRDTDRNRSDFCLNISVFGTSFFILSMVVLGLSVFINSFVPEPHETEHINVINSMFNANRVYIDLKTLSSVGPKVTGTYSNEIRAVDFLKQKITEIQSGTSQYLNKIEFDIQQASGCFSFTGKNTTQCYHNVQNVIVKLHQSRTNNSHDENILINCHFDSMPTSPGTSDDGLHCTVMLEFLRVLSVSEESLDKNVIFLFNGAEEDGLMASHGFITQHKWSRNIVSFINLEACGAGGREILFQTGPNAAVLPQIYVKSVPYPYGNVIGEELFQSGILPSDTDFRIFRDYGKLKGLDFAHFKNGYVYHTSDDNISFISTNVIQHTGSNILALLKGLINESDLKTRIENDQNQAVFFDVMGLFMVCYTTDVAFKLNLIVVFFSVLSMSVIFFNLSRNVKFWSLVYHVAINFGFFLVSHLMATAFIFGLSKLLEWRNLTMLWYANPWFAVVYYGLPAIFVAASFLRLRRFVFQSSLSVEKEALLFVLVFQNIITFIVFIATILHIRSVYALVICLVPLVVSHLLNVFIFDKSRTGIRLIIYVVLNSLSSFYITYISIPLFQLLIPMLGRMGVTVNNEQIIWIMCGASFLLIFDLFLPLVLLVKNFWKLLMFFAVTFTVFVCVILFATPLESFSDDAPQRFEITHVNRKVYFGADYEKTELNGFFLVPVDQRGPQSVKHIFNNNQFIPVLPNCSEIFFCGAPLSKYSIVKSNFAHSFWYPGEKLKPPMEKKIDFREIEEKQIKIFYIKVAGPAYSKFAILPLNNHTLIEWGTNPNSTVGLVPLINDNIFFISYVRGLGDADIPWSFWLKFDLSNVKFESYAFKMSWSAHYRVDNDTSFSASFKNVINKFPIWTRVTPGLAEVEEYLF